MATADAKALVKSGSGPWTDLGLTLPIFVGYHLGVVFLNVRNAADVVTRELVTLSENNLLAYGGLTLAIGVVYVGILMVLGRGHALRWERFAIVATEGIVYAVAMRLVAAYVVGRVFLATGINGTFTALVMSLGAGFYEEVVFRVILFGLGVKLLVFLFPIVLPLKAAIVKVVWALATAGVFSGWHYVGALGEAFDVHTFVFRWVCGLAFCVIYWFRGFAPAVWTHALYDIWVLVF
jgi:hypothetical protein